MNLDLLRACLRAGTWASLAMMPFGLLFRALDLRIGHYGKRLLEVAVGNPPAPWFQILLIAEHFIIGWISVLPLVWLWRHRIVALSSRLLIGTIYGLGYYLLLNAWLLPLAFGDQFPMQLGWSFVYPSLIVHVVFGLVAALARDASSVMTGKFLDHPPYLG